MAIKVPSSYGFGRFARVKPKDVRKAFGVAAGPPVYTPPTSAPPGTYDPSLDFQGEQANLGYGFNAQDYDLGFARRHEDYNRSEAELNADYGNTVGHGRQQYQDTLGALAKALARANEDYGLRTTELGQGYQRLGNRQGQSARAAGVSGGGALTQALAKRQVNQGQDQSKLDTAVNRYRDDNAADVARTNQSWRDLVGEDERGGTLGTQYQRSLAALHQALDRGGEDADLGYQRAGFENLLFQSQLGRAKTQSAEALGRLPTKPPGAIAGLPPGVGSYLFGGVEYGPGSNGFLAPVGTPTAQSVGLTGSLLGTRLDPKRKKKR